MDINTPLALLGGLTASQFMRKHWHKKPLLVRQAISGFKAPIPRARLLAMAGETDEEVLVVDLDRDRSERVRRMWPFLRDRRIDHYRDLVLRYRDRT